MLNTIIDKSRYSAKLNRLIPLSKNIEFHKLVAKVVAVCVVGHVLGHGLNYAENPDIR